MLNEPTHIIHLNAVHFGYSKSTKEALLYLEDFTFEKGALNILIGPNGAGKSTIIKTITGSLKPIAGSIAIGKKSITEYTPKSLSRIFSMVLTNTIPNTDLTVHELVSLGRSPYTNWFGKLSPQDHTIINEAIHTLNLDDLQHKCIGNLSDGEQQRAQIARCIAQDTPYIFLDEPTAHLDIPNRITLLSSLKDLARKFGKTILVSTHELDLALKYADNLWVLDRNQKQLNIGLPEELVLNGTFEKAFTNSELKFDLTNGTFFTPVQDKGTISISGDNISKYWTGRAFERNGFTVQEQAAINVKITKTDNRYQWVVVNEEHNISGVLSDLSKAILFTQKSLKQH